MKILTAVIAAAIAATAVAEPPVQAPYPASGWKPDGPAFELPPREPNKLTGANGNLEQDSYLPPAKLEQTDSSTPSAAYGFSTGVQGLPSAEPISPFISATQKTPADSFGADLKLFQQQLEKQQVQEFNTFNQGQKTQQNNNFVKEFKFRPQSQNIEQKNALFIRVNNKDSNPSANLVAAKPLKLIQPQQTYGQQYLAPTSDAGVSQLSQYAQLNAVPAFVQTQQVYGFAQPQDFVTQNPPSFAQFSQFGQLNTSPRFIPQEQPFNNEQPEIDQQNVNQQFSGQLNQKSQYGQPFVKSFEPENGNSFHQFAIQYPASSNGQYNQANPLDSKQITNPQFGQLNSFDGNEKAIPQFNQVKSFSNNTNINTQLGHFEAPVPQQKFENTNTQGRESNLAPKFDQQTPSTPGNTTLFGKSNGLETEQDNQFNNDANSNQNDNVQFQQQFGQFVAPQFGQLTDIQQAPQFEQPNSLNGYTQREQLFPSPQIFTPQPAPQEFGQIQTFVPSPAFGQHQSFGNQQTIPQSNLIPVSGKLQTFGQLQSQVDLNTYQPSDQDTVNGPETGVDDKSLPTQFAFGARNTPEYSTSGTDGRTNPGIGFPTYGTPVQSYGSPENRDPTATPKSTAETTQENVDELSSDPNSFDGPNIAISTAVADGRRPRGSARLRNLRRIRPLFTLDKTGRLVRLH